MTSATNTTCPIKIFNACFSEWSKYTRPHEGFAQLMAACESPIERALGAALLCVPFQHTRTIDVAYCTPEVWGNSKPAHELAELFLSKGRPDAWLVPQAQIGRYRVDFLLIFRPRAGRKLYQFVIECDGHDFHEVTKEQARHDKARDRHLTREGYVVVRFTGSEIYRDAKACASEVLTSVEAAVFGEADREYERKAVRAEESTV